MKYTVYYDNELDNIKLVYIHGVHSFISFMAITVETSKTSMARLDVEEFRDISKKWTFLGDYCE